MSQAGILKIPDSILPPDVPTSFVTNVGIAVPILNVLDILGTTIPAGSTPVITTGLGNTVTIEVQRSQAILATDATKIGLAAFNSSEFTVDANGFVSLTGGGGATESFAMQTGTSPVVPTGLGLVTFNGATVLAGTHPVRTDGTGATTMTLEVQLSQALAATDVTKVGLANFDSASFTVDANGFVQLIGDAAAISKVNVQTGTTPIVPLSGAITINGATVAAGTHPVRTDGTGANTMAVEVQISQAIASADVTKIGLSNYSSAQFAVDANGFVTLAGGTTAPVLGLVPDAHTAPGTTPVIPNGSGNITVTGSSTAAGSVPVQTNSLAANTIAVQVQKSQAIAATDATKIGLAAFNSADFTVDANGYVTLSGSGSVIQLDGDSGYATPASNIIYVKAYNTVNNCGSSVTFTGDNVHTISLNVTDANHNTIIGLSAGNATISGTGNVVLGESALNALTSGSNNVIIGISSGIKITTGQFNNVLGSSALQSLTTGQNNICIGHNAGNSYTSSESSNICIGNIGTVSESNVLRIGTQGSSSAQQNACYIAGIVGVTASNAEYVTINSSTGQLGVAALTSAVTFTGDSGTPFSNNAVTVTGDTTGLTFSASTPFLTLAGTLNLTCGGTNANLVASNGGIFYSTATAGAILSGTATANKLLLSGASSAPAWSTTTYPSTNAINTLLYASSANVMGVITAANNGVLISGTTGIPSWLAAGTTGQILTATTGSPPSWASPATSGTVTTVSVVSANGFAGTVANATTTPAITLTTTATGLLSGNGTAISGLATANYAILNTSSSGVPSITASPTIGVNSGATLVTIASNSATALALDNGVAHGTIPLIDLYHDAATVATDYAYEIDFNAQNSTPAKKTYASIQTQVAVNTATSEMGTFLINTINAGSSQVNVQVGNNLGQYRGTQTNTAPPAGFIGEQIKSTIARASAISLTTTTPANVTSINLTAGIWDISGIVMFGGVVTGTQTNASINTTSATLGTAGDNYVQSSLVSNATSDQALTIPSWRLTLSSTTTVYLVASSVFSVGTETAYGRISATRVG